MEEPLSPHRTVDPSENVVVTVTVGQFFKLEASVSIPTRSASFEVAHFSLHGTVLSPPVPPESFAGLHTRITQQARRKRFGGEGIG